MPRIALAQVGAHFRAAARALTPNLKNALEVTAKDARRVAIRLSSGTLTTAVLRQRGHPYARRNPTSPNPEVINAQSGVFRAAWQIQAPVVSGGSVVSAVVNVSAVAAFMGGTRFMVPRPIGDAVQAAVLPELLARSAQAVQDAFLRP